MTAQVKALAAPELKEAEHGVLHVGKLEGPATGLVHTYPNQAERDVVTLSVKTSTGNSFEADTVVTAAGVGKPVTFAIPKDVFEKKLVPGASVKLYCTVTDDAGNSSASPSLTVQLKL
ncbi:hypothetical protein [Pseudomonas fluorescens]|uniref:Ig-like domain-containing protein n=1 Tax=Pseudomonas fluorescens TaxID=294 RepID=A0A423L9Z2_PSEFL|nr:hypothetical protein [Pseudomonas fluorescens]RON65108.1 hypothetical protein BK671_18640 [Pseudomonas fluorescens]